MTAKEKKAKKAFDITVEIFKIILEEHNGYSQQQIQEDNLAVQCESSVEFGKIQEIILKNIK